MLSQDGETRDFWMLPGGCVCWDQPGHTLCPWAPSASTSQLSNQREPLPRSLLTALTLSHPSARTRTRHQSKDLLWAWWILIQSWLSIQVCFLASTTTLAGDPSEEKEVDLGDCGARWMCVEGSIAPFWSTSLVPPENMQWQWEELPAASCHV